ncbi:GntR family transcriptional regulator [Anaerotalea alkaliphila]|uniref:GntR family transcriptional regulator n=1 Tax=Anaerotalea alkaliphila TaxID=2662126 RepID=A0A7X5KL60_9FIRM|nr:GntR family transcriptional regulator [Anaerotalea alkaliphila]NDL66364.1 GntR family transcriptional regulator [Anaerotalea alkaliphila]
MDSLYLRLKKDLAGKIQDQTYKPGDKLPPERTLAKDYGVSRMTLRQALKELEEEGALLREPGRGTFVASPSFLQQNVKSFTETIRGQGYEPTTRILEFSTIYDSQVLSQRLGVDRGTRFYKLKRLRLGSGTPIALETLYIPEESCPGLGEKELEGSLYKVLEEEYGFTVTNISCQMDAVMANRSLMEILQLGKPMALLKVNGITYAQNGRKLFYEESWYRPDLYRYQVDILKRN